MEKHRLTQLGRAMKELGVQMIAAYSPQARGRSERSFGTWQGRLPQELCLAGITTVEGANAFLRERHIGEFNAKFSVPVAEKDTAFRRTGRSDLDWIFSVQTERVVNLDNTVAIGDRSWQIDKTRFRNILARSTVTIHEHLDETVSIRFGPHVVGRYSRTGEKLTDIQLDIPLMGQFSQLPDQLDALHLPCIGHRCPSFKTAITRMNSARLLLAMPTTRA